MEQKKYIEKLELQVDRQQKMIEQYEREVFYLTNLLEEKSRRVEELEAQGLGKKRRRGRPNLSEQQKERIVMLVKEGNSYRKVSELTGTSIGAISGVMRQHEDEVRA